jgi:hypothetical protein
VQLRSGLILPDGAELPVKTPARVASGTNVTISGPGATIDGVTMAAGDRVLLTGQTTGSENGPYTWNGAAVAMTRTVDASVDAHFFRGWEIGVLEGTLYGGSEWRHTTSGTVTVGTTSIVFTRFNQDAWTTLVEGGVAIGSAVVAGTYPFLRGAGAGTPLTSAMPTSVAAFAMDSASYAGRVTPQVRLVAWVLSLSATAPAITFTFHTYSFTTAAGVFTLTAATGEQAVAFASPAANTMQKTYGTPFTMPAAAGQGFVVAVVTSGTTAASSSSVCGARLEVRMP